MQILEIVNYIIELPTKGFFPALRIFFIVLSLFLATGVIYLLLTTNWYEKRYQEDSRNFWLGGDKRESRWSKHFKRIRKRLEKSDPAEHKLAIIEAGRYLEKFLSKQGFEAKALIEQLRKLSPEILSLEQLNNLSKAYQIRDNIIHDPDYKLSLDESKKVVDIFEKTFQDLGST